MRRCTLGEERSDGALRIPVYSDEQSESQMRSCSCSIVVHDSPFAPRRSSNVMTPPSFRRLHPNLLSSIIRAYSENNYSCDELVKFVDERCKRDTDELARRGSTTFVSSMLHMTSRLGCFWASNFYSAFTAQSARISEHGREGDTRSCTKALVGLALAGRIGENEDAVRDMWEAMMFRVEDLTQGNLREVSCDERMARKRRSTEYTSMASLNRHEHCANLPVGLR